MGYYRKRTPVIEAVKWTEDNFEEVKKLCPEAIIDDAGRLWIPAFVNMYCVQGSAFIIKDLTARQLYHAYKPSEFNDVFEEVPNV